jgi:hypothetical protein
MDEKEILQDKLIETTATEESQVAGLVIIVQVSELRYQKSSFRYQVRKIFCRPGIGTK